MSCAETWTVIHLVTTLVVLHQSDGQLPVVLVLELVTGRRAVEYGEDDVAVLTDQVRVALERAGGDDDAAAERVVDPALRGEFPEEEALPVLKLGVVCTSQIPSNRPSMAEVVQILQVIRAPSLPGCTAQLF